MIVVRRTSTSYCVESVVFTLMPTRQTSPKPPQT
jgi:hypothetical protein